MWREKNFTFGVLWKKLLTTSHFFRGLYIVLLVAVRLFSFRPGKVSPTADKNNFSGRKISIQSLRICIQSLWIHIRKLRLYIRNLWIKNWIMAFQLFRTAEKTFSGRERSFLLLLSGKKWIFFKTYCNEGIYVRYSYPGSNSILSLACRTDSDCIDAFIQGRYTFIRQTLFSYRFNSR